jgi:hypothetical protein
MLPEADALQVVAKLLMRFNVTIANLIWSITSLLFAVKGQKTAKVWLFLRRLHLRKAEFPRQNPARWLFFAANNSEDSDDAQGLPVGAAAGSGY